MVMELLPARCSLILHYPFHRCSNPSRSSVSNFSTIEFNAKHKRGAPIAASIERDVRSSNRSLGSMELLEQQSLDFTVREASLGDYWGVADTHCAAFLPDLVFPLDAILRIDRVLAMIGGFPLPTGCQRKCLVAVGVDNSPRDILFDWKSTNGGARHGFECETVLGVLTIDTVAEFLPKKKKTGKRRKGIAYVSNVAVQQRARRMGIASRLVQEAETLAMLWGCHSIALHCDKNNPGALALYLGAGYKIVKAPHGAKWPQPKASSGSEFCLMMKFLGFS